MRYGIKPDHLHPYILTHSNYTLYRVKELGVLSDLGVKDALAQQHVELTTYKQVSL